MKKIHNYLFVAVLFAGAAASQKTQGGGGISIAISLPQADNCLNSRSLTVDSIITNSSNSDVILSPSGLMYAAQYSKRDGIGQNMFYSLREVPPAEWITLHSGETITIPVVEPIGDTFFQDESVFTIRLDFAQYVRLPSGYKQSAVITSNPAFWKQIDCQKK
jgi:hypothetical protein